MKIGIPVEKKDESTQVAKSFGRSSDFFIYNTKTKDSMFIENQAKNSRGGAGITAAQTIVDNDIEILLTPQCGENAAEVLEKADIKIYKTEGVDLQENISKFINKKLTLLEDIHSGYHNHE